MFFRIMQSLLVQFLLYSSAHCNRLILFCRLQSSFRIAICFTMIVNMGISFVILIIFLNFWRYEGSIPLDITFSFIYH